MSGNWRLAAACRTEDPELFFPEGPAQSAPATKVCTSCSVRRECLSFAVATSQVHGVWGGMTGEDRERLIRRRAAKRRAIAGRAA